MVASMSAERSGVALAGAASAGGVFAAIFASRLLDSALRQLRSGKGPWSLRGLIVACFTLVQNALDFLPEDVRRPLVGSLYITVPMGFLGAITGVLYKLSFSFQTRMHMFLAKHCQVTMCFSNKDRHYDHIVDYIGSRCRVATGRILASTKPRQKPSFQEMLAGWLGGKTKAPTFYYQPDIQEFSSFFFWTDEKGKSHKIWISRVVEKPQMRSDNGNKGADPEVLSLSLWWTTDASILKEFMSSALKAMLRDDSDGKVDIYVKHMWLPIWSKAVSKERRDRDTVILDGEQADYVIADIRHFFTAKTADWYHNAGIPYRRGYLLYGPPGCGKTSFAQVLAGELMLDVCLMNLSNQDMNDDDLAELLRAAPPRSMMLLEDVDAIFVERAAASERSRRGGGISFSGLLNALDGAAAQEGCIIMMTTNHKDRLDEALIRPGRCDVHVKVDKASKDQAKRMFNRFFALEATIASVTPKCTVRTAEAHGFAAGNAVRCRSLPGAPLMRNGRVVEEAERLYVGYALGLDPCSLALFGSQEEAVASTSTGADSLSGGEGARLQVDLDAAERFACRIPPKQVSMAKLQGYLMKQKLLAEQQLQRSLLCGELPEDEISEVRVHRLASESAVMNVHELLEVKADVEEVKVSIYDHLRRVGLHQFAPFFEYFGVRTREDFKPEVKDAMGNWDLDLKVNGPQRRRLVALIDKEEGLMQSYALADLSVLRDRFLQAYPVGQASVARLAAPAQAADAISAPSPPPPLLRSKSAPVGATQHAIPKRELLRMSSGRADDLETPATQELDGLKLLEMAHEFQERLEDNGKTDISLWQLNMHFDRYAHDPVGALQNCGKLLHLEKDRAPAEKTVQWCTTYAFLRRLGLEKYAYTIEDAGLPLLNDWKHLGKDEIKEKGEMSNKDASFCHAVLQNNSERADLLGKFQVPTFMDIKEMFLARFPGQPVAEVQAFARALTDELGVAVVSRLQLERYLEGLADAADARLKLSIGLPSEAAAQAARVRPEAPAPPPKKEDWLQKWLSEASDGNGGTLEAYEGKFRNENLVTLQAILAASLDQGSLKAMGVDKLGDRCNILRLIEETRSSTSSAARKNQFC